MRCYELASPRLPELSLRGREEPQRQIYYTETELLAAVRTMLRASNCGEQLTVKIHYDDTEPEDKWAKHPTTCGVWSIIPIGCTCSLSENYER